MTSSDRRVQLQPLLVLHARPYGDTSIIADCLTVDHGRLALLVKGGRKTGGAGRGRLQPFTPLMCSWSGRGELPTLTHSESNGVPFGLVGALTVYGLYINELLVRTLPRGEGGGAVYFCYLRVLERLSQGQHIERSLRLFEKELLQELGYGVILDVDVRSGESITAEQWYRYEIENGPSRVIGNPSPEDLKGASLLSLAREELYDETSLADAKRLMRRLLAPHLGAQPLRSRELFRAIKDMGPLAGVETDSTTSSE